MIKHLENYKAELRLKNLETILFDAEEIPLPDKSVDYIIANAVFDLLDDSIAVREWKRILKPNGKIFVSVVLDYKYVHPLFLPLHIVYDSRHRRLRTYNLEKLQKIFDLPVEKVYYTGHLKKTLWLLLKYFGLSIASDKKIEEIDRKEEDKPQGASNLIVIFKN